MPIGPRTEQQAAGSEAADEDGQHRGRCGRGRSENKPEIPQPTDLVGECAEAGRKKEAGDSPGAGWHVQLIGTGPLARQCPDEQQCCARAGCLQPQSGLLPQRDDA